MPPASSTLKARSPFLQLLLCISCCVTSGSHDLPHWTLISPQSISQVKAGMLVPEVSPVHEQCLAHRAFKHLLNELITSWAFSALTFSDLHICTPYLSSVPWDHPRSRTLRIERESTLILSPFCTVNSARCLNYVFSFKPHSDPVW